MAKRNGAAAAAPTQAAQAVTPGGSLAADLARRARPAEQEAHPEPSVVDWDGGNGQSVFQAGTLPPDVQAADDAGKEAAETAPAETTDSGAAKTETEGNQGDGGAEPGTVSPPAVVEAAKPKGTQARRSAFAALEAERSRVTLEQQARQNADKATAAEAELARIKKLPLREQLKWLGVDKETLSEAVLVDGDDVAELPDKPAAKPSPEIEELRAEVRALKADKAARGATEAQAAVSQGHAVVAEALKDVATVPMVKGVRDVVVDGQYVHSGVDLTLKTAHQAWLQAGKAGHPRDYVAGAAEVVEAYLREKRPDMAAYMVPAAGAGKGQQQDPPPARGNGAPASIGKRTGARPDAQPVELPLDRHERDRQVKKEMGWL